MSRHVSTPRGDFFVNETGAEAAPVVLFVAGLGDDHASWAEVVARLSSRHRCITFDNRGIGRSPITPGPYTIDEMALDAHALVGALGLGPVAAVGSSMGGAICQRWAAEHPEDLSALVLTNTWAERDPYLTVLFDHWIDLAEARAGKALLQSLLLFCFSPPFLAEHREIGSSFVNGPTPDLVGLAAAAAACRDHHALDRLSGIALPTLVIAGARDILTRPAFSASIVRAMPAATLATIDAAHMIFWERPDEFCAAVADFLTSCV